MNFAQRALIPDDVLMRIVVDEAVLLNLKTATYFNLNGVGTHIWQLLAQGETLDAVYRALQDTYEVEAPVLRADLIALVEALVAEGLLELRDA